MHRLKDTVSFDNVKKIMGACEGHRDNVFVGTVDGNLVISVNFVARVSSEPTAQVGSKRKRKLDPHEEAAEDAVKRVRKGLSDEVKLTDDHLETAKKAVHALLANVRGPQGEKVVESYGLSYKTAEKTDVVASNYRPRLILSARLSPGAPVPLEKLFRALGTKCSQDGMLTVQDSSTLANGFNLPLSEHAEAAVAHGQKAVSLFATVSQ